MNLSANSMLEGKYGYEKMHEIYGKAGFHVQDVIFLLICLGAFAAQIYVLAARG